MEKMPSFGTSDRLKILKYFDCLPVTHLLGSVKIPMKLRVAGYPKGPTPSSLPSASSCSRPPLQPRPRHRLPLASNSE